MEMSAVGKRCRDGVEDINYSLDRDEFSVEIESRSGGELRKMKVQRVLYCAILSFPESLLF